MALLFIDGFDHYTTLTQKGWAISIYGGVTTGRNGSGGYTGASYVAGNNGNVSRSFPASGEVVWGTAINWGALDTIPYLQLREGATVHLDVRPNASGFLEFRRGAGGTLLATGATNVGATNTWFYLEIRIKCHDTTGTLAAKVNSVSQFTPLTSTDTRNGGAAGNLDTMLYLADRVTFSGTQHNWFFDDVYLCDVSGSVNNDFLGDVKVETLFPNGNGNSSVLVGSDANSTDNYLLVDETAPNDDTDYVESSTVGDEDTYTYTNVATLAGSVYGVQLCPYAKKTDAGTRQIVSVARLSSTEVDSAAKVLTTSYVYLPDVRETKPGGGAWTFTDVNAAEFGVKINL